MAKNTSDMMGLLLRGMLPLRYRILSVLGILTIAAFVLGVWYEPNYGAGVDEASYFLGAKELALHGDSAYRNADPMVFVPENMVEPAPGVYYPIYSIGYPLLAAIGYKLGGPEGAFWVNPILTLAALAGAFLLARHFVNDFFAVAALLILAMDPVVLHYGVGALSHAADLAFATWGLYFTCNWHRKPALWKIVVAGFLLGYAACIRYTEVILLLPLAWMMIVRAKGLPSEMPGMRRLVFQMMAGGAGWLAGVLPALWCQAEAFGSPFQTGYGLGGESSAFSWHWFLEHAGFAVSMLCTPPCGLILLPLALIALFLWKWVTPREAGFLGLAFVPTLLIYTAYYWINRAEPMLYARFFLTAYPVILVAALLPLDRITRLRPLVRYALLAGLVIYASVNFSLSPPQTRFNGVLIVDEAVTDMVRKHLPKDAVIVPDGFTAYSLVYYTDMTVIYPRYFSEKWVRDEAAPPAPGSGLPMHFNPLRTEEFKQALGNRTQAQLNSLLEDKLLNYARQGRTVAIIMQADTPPWYVFLQAKFKFTPVAQDDQYGLTLWRLEAK